MKKSITLIELMVVIVVIGILAALAIPNIKNIKNQSQLSNAFENKTNVQKGVDRYLLEKQNFPTQSQPTVGNPVLIDWTKLEPPFLVQRPQDLNKFYYWVDSFGTVWMSDIDAPNNLSMSGTGTVTIGFDENLGAEEYQVGYIETTASRNMSSLNAGSGYTWAKKGQKGDGNFVSSSGKIQTTIPESDLNGKVLIVSAISKNGLQTAPVGVGYKGTVLSTDITQNATTKNGKPTAVITSNPNTGIETTTNVIWDYANSTDPDSDTISTAEWKLDGVVNANPNGTLTVGSHTMELRVRDSRGLWSDWVTQVVTVSQPKKLQEAQLGEYVRYGNYNGHELVWRVVKNNTSDLMLFLTEPIKNNDGSYMQMSFDTTASKYGSSGIRTWLNNTFYTNAFSNQGIIKGVNHDYIIASYYAGEITKGSFTHVYNTTFATSLQNYTTNAVRSTTIGDKVYLVNIEELVSNIQPTIGSDYYNAAYSYWLRDTYAASALPRTYVRHVSSTGSLLNSGIANNLPVRPAFNVLSSVYVSGSGTQTDPYVIQ